MAATASGMDSWRKPVVFVKSRTLGGRSGTAEAPASEKRIAAARGPITAGVSRHGQANASVSCRGMNAVPSGFV